MQHQHQIGAQQKYVTEHQDKNDENKQREVLVKYQLE